MPWVGFAELGNTAASSATPQTPRTIFLGMHEIVVSEEIASPSLVRLRVFVPGTVTQEQHSGCVAEHRRQKSAFRTTEQEGWSVSSETSHPLVHPDTLRWMTFLTIFDFAAREAAASAAHWFSPERPTPEESEDAMFARFSPGEDFAFVMALNVPVPVEWSGSYRDLEICVEPRLPDRKLVEARLQRLVADAEPGEALGEAQLFRPRARQSAVARPGDFVVLEVSVTHLATGAPVWSFERRVATLSTCEADLLLFSGLGRAMEGRQEGEVAVLEEVETEASDARLPFWMRMGPLAQPPRWRVEARLLRVLGQSSEAALEAWLEARAGKVQSLRDLRVDLAQTLLEESADDARQRAGLALLAALESRLRVPEGLEGRGEGKGASAPGGSAAATAQFRSAAPASSQSAAPLNLDPIPDARHLVLAELLRQALAGSLAPAEARQLGARAQEFLAPGGGGDAAAAALRRAWAGVCDVAAREGLGRDGGGLQDELRRQRGSQAMEDWDKLRFALSEPQVRRLVDLEATLREVTAWAAGWGGVQVRRGAAAEALEESVTRLGAAGLLEINA